MTKNNTNEISIHSIEELITKIRLDETKIGPLEEKIRKLEISQESYLQIKKNKDLKFKDNNNDIITDYDKNESMNNSNNDNDNELQNAVIYHLSLINSLSEENDIEDEIEMLLPVKKNKYYANLMILIKSELVKNIKEIKDLIDENELTRTDLIDFKNEICLNERKLRAINNVEFENNNSDDQNENNLIFVPTSNGNIRAINEISDIEDSNYMDLFKTLFDSIKDGTFKNIKQFNINQNQEKSIWQVKHGKARIVFDRIGKKEYAIITAFIKEGQNEKLYRDGLAIKTNNYFRQRKKIKDNLSNNEFLDLNKDCECELYDLLNRYSKGENSYVI